MRAERGVTTRNGITNLGRLRHILTAPLAIEPVEAQPWGRSLCGRSCCPIEAPWALAKTLCTVCARRLGQELTERR